MCVCFGCGYDLAGSTSFDITWADTVVNCPIREYVRKSSVRPSIIRISRDRGSEVEIQHSITMIAAIFITANFSPNAKCGIISPLE